MELHTARLRLREFEKNDWRAVHQYSADPEVVRHLTWGPNTEADTRRFVAQVISRNRRSPRKFFDFLLESREAGEVIGAVGLYIRENSGAELGWLLKRDCWNHGYAAEAVSSLLEFAFEALRLHRVFAGCFAENAASLRVMEKVGMRREACYKQSRASKNAAGGWSDEYLFAMLEEEWCFLHRGGV